MTHEERPKIVMLSGRRDGIKQITIKSRLKYEITLNCTTNKQPKTLKFGLLRFLVEKN